jgi:hypothetical protein
VIRILTIFLFFGSVLNAQPFSPYPLPRGVKGKAWLLQSAFSPFPDSLRNASPRTYQGKTYPTAEHYTDSSVLVFVPDYFDKSKAVNFVYWFHGWNNNIDTAVKHYQLLEQFYAARRNAVFIFPQGPKNAPDSYGGKMEQEGGLFRLNGAVEKFLVHQKALKPSGVFPFVTLCGHSGAYRAIGKSLADGAVAEVYLFDGLYGLENEYLEFCKPSAYPHRLLHIYTDNGGTKELSGQFMRSLDRLGIAYLHKPETDITTRDLQEHRIIFLHSKVGHSEVITHQQNYERFLRAGTGFFQHIQAHQ